MTNKSKLKLKKLNFLSRNRVEKMNDKYNIEKKTIEKTDDNIYRFTRRGLRSQHI